MAAGEKGRRGGEGERGGDFGAGGEMGSCHQSQSVLAPIFIEVDWREIYLEVDSFSAFWQYSLK